jgi:hypothetical protein
MFLEVFLKKFFDEDSVFYQSGFVDFDFEDVLMEEEIGKEMDGFSDEGLALLMIVDGYGEDFALDQRKDLSGDKSIEWLERSEFAIKSLESLLEKVLNLGVLIAIQSQSI